MSVDRGDGFDGLGILEVEVRRHEPSRHERAEHRPNGLGNSRALFVALDLAQRLHQPGDRVVGVRYRRMPRRALGAKRDPARTLLAGADTEHRDVLAEELRETVRAFVDHQRRVEQLGRRLLKKPDSLLTAGLLVRHGQKDQIVLQSQTVSFRQRQHHEFHDAHAFHVERTAPPDHIVDEIAGERINAPVFRLGRHDIDVGQKHDRLAPSPFGRWQPCRDRDATITRVVITTVDALAGELATQKVCAGFLSTGRVGGIDSNVFAEQVGGLLGDLGPVDVSGRVLHGAVS